MRYPAIRANLESRGWLSPLEIDYRPPTALIKEFFSNLSCHIYDSNTVVRSWIRGFEFTITPRVVAQALGVPVVTNPVYPYDESRLLRYLRPHICFLELCVIPCGLFLISTPSLWSDVFFFMLSCQVHLSAFLTCFFVL